MRCVSCAIIMSLFAVGLLVVQSTTSKPMAFNAAVYVDVVNSENSIYDVFCRLKNVPGLESCMDYITLLINDVENNGRKKAPFNYVKSVLRSVDKSLRIQFGDDPTDAAIKLLLTDLERIMATMGELVVA